MTNDHTQQNGLIVNSYINARHLKDNVDQKSFWQTGNKLLWSCDNLQYQYETAHI